MVTGLAASELTDARALFRRQLVNALAYWERQVAEHAGDLAALDRELANVARAVEWGLRSDDVLPEALRLLAAAHDVIVRRGSALFGTDLLALVVRAARAAGSADECAALLDLAAQLYDRRGMAAEAEGCYRESLARNGDNAGLRAPVQVELGRFLVEHERAAEGLPVLEDALTQAGALGDVLTQASALLALGWHHHYQTGDGLTAERYLLRALPLLEALEETNLLARVWIDLANAHWRLGDYDRAEQDCARAQAYLPRSGNLRLQAMVEAMRGALLCDRGCFAESLDYLARAERMYGTLGEGHELANVYQNLAVSYWGLKQWERSIDYSRTALQLWHACERVGREAETQYNLAEAYLAMGACREARAALDEARACVARQQERLGPTRWVQNMLAHVAALDEHIRERAAAGDAAGAAATAGAQ